MCDNISSIVCDNSFDNLTLIPPSSEDSQDYDNDEVPYPDLTQIPAVCTGFIVIYALIFIISMFGNAAVCFTVISNRKMQTVVNCYIVNLALCDLMVGTFVLPVKLLELTAPASWGALNDGLCTLMLYLQTVFVFASVLTLVATCIERYLAIVHPLESRVQQSRSRTAKILLIVWLLPCLGAAPFLYPSEAVENTLTSDYGTISRLTCFTNFSPEFRRVYYTFLFVFFYAIPLTFIAWTCIRITQCLLQTSTLHREGSIRRQEINRRKVAKMILIVVAAFAISWTPYFLITIITQYSSNFMSKHNFFFTMLSINLFAFLNSSINPFIYAVMSSRFRTGFVSVLRCIFCVHSDGSSINGSNPINSNQLRDGVHQTPPNHRFRGRSAIARYHRQVVLMVCRGPTQVSTDSLPPTDSPHHMNHINNQNVIIHRNLTNTHTDEHEMDQIGVAPNDVLANGGDKYEGNQIVSTFVTKNGNNNEKPVPITKTSPRLLTTNHVIQKTTVHLTELTSDDESEAGNHHHKRCTKDDVRCNCLEGEHLDSTNCVNNGQHRLLNDHGHKNSKDDESESEKMSSDPLSICCSSKREEEAEGKAGAKEERENIIVCKEKEEKEEPNGLEGSNEGRVKIAGQFFSLSEHSDEAEDEDKGVMCEDDVKIN